jgi:hypothetical protein
MTKVPMIAVLLATASPVAAAPWTHPEAGFALDIPAGWEERVAGRTPTSAAFLPSPSFLATIVCTVVTAPLKGPPASPSTWRMPDQVIADPQQILTRNGDSVSAVMGSQKFAGADGFPGWQLWADVVKTGEAAPYFKLISHVLTEPNTQVTMVCITPSGVRGSLSAKTIDEGRALGLSLRDAK